MYLSEEQESEANQMDFISHCIKENRNKIGSRGMLGIISILIAFSLLGGIYLTQASHVAITGRRVQELEAQKKQLQEQNMQLMAEIAELESVQRLAQRAQELGFVRPDMEQLEFLVIAEPSASPDPMLAQNPSDDWWSDVVAQFQAWTQAEAQ